MLKDKSECLMSSNGELDGSNGTQHNIKEVKEAELSRASAFLYRFS